MKQFNREKQNTPSLMYQVEFTTSRSFSSVAVLHIDEGGLFGLSEEEVCVYHVLNHSFAHQRKSKNETLEKITKEYSYPFKSVPLEAVLSLTKLPSLEDNNSTRGTFYNNVKC